MNDRDKDLTHLFVRDLDEIPLPARGVWRPTARKGTILMRSSRNLLTAGAVVAVLAIALIVGLQLNQRQQGVAVPSSSPTATAPIVATSGPTGKDNQVITCPQPNASCAATGTPSSSNGIYDDAFGFIVTENLQDKIRTESSNARGPSFSSSGYAVSPDGTRLAFWTQAPSEAAGGPQQLFVYDLARPTVLVASSALGANERGGGIVWSNDNRGITYAIQTGPQPTSSVIWAWDLASGGPAKVALSSTQPGAFYVPIAWDRTRLSLVAAGLSGPGGFMTDYVTVNPAVAGSARSVKVQFDQLIRVFSVRASSDAAFALALDATGFTYWPIDTMTGAGKHPAESKYGLSGGAVWRPGTHEIGFIGPSNQFWLCNVERETPLGCGTTAFSGVPDGAHVQAFRADGSAVLLGVSLSGSTNPTSYTLVRFGSDPKATSGDRVAFTDVSGITASVRLR